MGFGEKKKKYSKSAENKKPCPEVEKTLITEEFEKYAKELELKQDKYERLVKISRDITIASKRAIFSLHALLRSGNYDGDLAQVNETLETVRSSLLKNIVLELAGEDPYQYSRAFTAGLQEYIEALTFYHFLTKGKLFNLDELREQLTFVEDGVEQGDLPKQKVPLPVQLLDYVLGVQDLTGEIMRHCISCFGARNMEAGFNDCNFMKQLYTGMLVLNLNRNRSYHGKEFSRKLNVALDSLKKMEMACYATHIRGSEQLDIVIDTNEPQSGFDNDF